MDYANFVLIRCVGLGKKLLAYFGQVQLYYMNGKWKVHFPYNAAEVL